MSPVHRRWPFSQFRPIHRVSWWLALALVTQGCAAHREPPVAVASPPAGTVEERVVIRERTIAEVRVFMNAVFDDDGNFIDDRIDLVEGNADDHDGDGDLDVNDGDVPDYGSPWVEQWHLALPADSLFLWRSHLPVDSVLIRCLVPAGMTAQLAIVDSLGARVRTLADSLAVGPHEILWGCDVDPGAVLVPGQPYYVVLASGGHRRVRRIRWELER